MDTSLYKLDIEGLRRGRYADPPYLNIVSILETLASSGYNLPINDPTNSTLRNFYNVGESHVESHWIVRRSPFAVIAGVPKALAILKECTGFYENNEFINTIDKLEVFAVEDGQIVEYDGNASHALPILITRGRFRDFALLKTPILGVLARATRIATNVYEVLQAANGKPVYFFSARYDPHEIQAIDGYAYHIAVNCYNKVNNLALSDVVSTYANAEWWDGEIEGTVSHEAISCFLGNATELMLKFAEVLPVNRIRVALVDFHNDCISDTQRIMSAFFARYKECVDGGNLEDASRYILHGVRLDTSKELLDASIYDNVSSNDYGVSPRLVRNVREAIDNAWHSWDMPEGWKARAEAWCKNVKIMVSGGFTKSKIKLFEDEKVPVDFYGVGSSLLSNCAETNTTTDFSSVITRVKVGNEWVDMAKKGRKFNLNPGLLRVSFD